MKPSLSHDNDGQDQDMIRLLKKLGSLKPEYPPELFANRRAAFLAALQQYIATTNEKLGSDERFIQALQELGAVRAEYPPELLAARRAAFLAQLKQTGQGSPADAREELSPGDQRVIDLLGALKPVEAEYPPYLLAARRSALLQQIRAAKKISLADRLRASLQDIVQTRLPAFPPLRLPDRMRASLVVASLLVAMLFTSLVFAGAGLLLHRPPFQAAGPTRLLPTGTYLMATLLCKPGDPAPPCPSPVLDPGQDLADQVNGVARPAVSKDALASSGGIHKAAYVNDGRSGPSWVSKSADSWIKIDLGKVTTFNSVSLQKGSLGASPDDNLGQFVIAVASSDVYSDGNSRNDYTEYAQVFNSAQTGFSGMVPNAQTVSALFPTVKARYVKITFAKAGAAIDEVGVFMVQPPVLTQQPTTKPEDDLPEARATPGLTSTLSATDTVTSFPTSTSLATGTLTSSPTGTPLPSPTSTLPPSETPTLLPTNTLPPAETATPVPTQPLPSDTPLPSPTAIPPTPVPPTAQLPAASPDPIIVTGNGQTLTFTCNGNDFTLRGHANTVTLLGSCSSITVTGNDNTVLWQLGSPVITNRGIRNIISQM